MTSENVPNPDFSKIETKRMRVPVVNGSKRPITFLFLGLALLVVVLAGNAYVLQCAGAVGAGGLGAGVGARGLGGEVGAGELGGEVGAGGLGAEEGAGALGAEVGAGGLGAQVGPAGLAQTAQIPPGASGTVTCLGRLEPAGEVVKLSAPTSSQESLVCKLDCEEGETIKKGQILAILDSEARLKASVEQSRSQVAVAQAQLALTKAGAKRGEIEAQRFEVKRLQAALAGKVAAQRAIISKLDSAYRQAAVDCDRYKFLYGERAVSSFDFDQKSLAKETAWQNLSEAKAVLAQIEIAEAAAIESATATLERIAEVRPLDVDAAQASLSQARCGLLQAQAALGQAYIRSPLDGKILKIYARPGEKIAEEGFADVGRTQTMMALAEVYQSDINKIAPGQPVTVTADALPGHELHGVVKSIGQEVRRQKVINSDPSANIDERVVEVRVLLDRSSSARAANLSNSQVTAIVKL